MNKNHTNLNTPPSAPQKEASFWTPYASYCTTGQFFRLKRGYKNHCGPTAITNVIMTLKNRDRAEENMTRGGLPYAPAPSGSALKETAKKIFLDVAAFGSKHLLYFNMNLFRFYGGTSDILSGLYLTQMLRKQGIKNAHVSLSRPLTPSLVRRALDRGSILYIMLIRHKKYKSHHLICYGYTESDDGSFRYLTADGWASSPTYLTDSDFRIGLFREIR